MDFKTVVTASLPADRWSQVALVNFLLVKVDRRPKQAELTSKQQQVRSHGAAMILLVMQALHEPERICAASERDSTPTIRDGSPAYAKRR